MLSDEEFESLGFTFIWRIENFSYCPEKHGQYIKSPMFVMDSSVGRTGWYVDIYPRRGLSCKFTEYFLRKDECFGATSITLDYELSIIAADGSLQESIEEESFQFTKGILKFGKEKRVAQDKMFRTKKDLYLPNNTLTLHCRMWESGRFRSWLGQSFARTRVGVEKRSVVWPVEKFSTLQMGQDRPCLLVPSLKEELSISIYLTPGMDSDPNIRIEISQKDASQDNLTSCRICVLDSECSPAFLTSDDYWFEKKEGVQVWDFPFFVLRSSLLANKSLYLPNNTLSIRCECAMSTGVLYSELEDTELLRGQWETPHVNSFMGEIPHRNIKNVAKLSKISLKADLLSLYRERTFCDFNLRSGSEVFPVHRAVLAARSSVFRAKISTDMAEKNADLVHIADLDGDTVRRMLLFMYTDAIGYLQWDAISKLYFAADKYGILALKQKCSEYLESNLSPSNVCEALELGDLHRDVELKTAAVKLIFQNDDKILRSDEWRQLLKRNGQLAAETMHSMYLKKVDA